MKRDLFEPCYEYQEPELVRATGLYPYFRALSGSEGPVVEFDGRPVVMLGSNNYLGLTHHPAVMKAAHEAIDRYGTGCTGSRFLNGNLDLHDRLEERLAEFLGKEDCLVFASGFLANFGVVGWLAGHEGAVAFSERGNHASLIDGARYSRAQVRVFDGPEDLERQLSEHEKWPHALVITDSVFSMTGAVTDLKRIAELRRRHGFRLYVDDAHGFGVLGQQGRGTCAEQGVADQVDLIFGTFSKSLASMGGFVAGERAVIDYLRHKVRTLIFSAAMPPSAAAAALASLEIMQSDNALFDRLWENVRFFREGLERLGYHTMGSRTPILPLFVGSESLSFRMTREALDQGVFVTPVISPAVPLGRALLRTSVMPTHTREHLQKALDVLGGLIEKYPAVQVDPDEVPEREEMDFSYLLPQEAEAAEVAAQPEALG